MPETIYKLLRSNGDTPHGYGTWPLTGDRMPRIRGRLEACRNGYHGVYAHQIMRWVEPRGGLLVELEAIESPGVVNLLDAYDKVVVRQARVSRIVGTLDDRTMRLLAADFAEHVLPIFESRVPGDDRPRRAIDAARRYTRGDTNAEELCVFSASAAASASASASTYAASASASAAAAAASASASYATASASAATYAAASAASAAAIYTAASAASASERRWQGEHLIATLERRSREDA